MSLSDAATDLLIATDDARQAIARKDVAGAREHVNLALDLAVRLNGAGVVPIYSELSRVSLISPVAAAKASSPKDTPPSASKTSLATEVSIHPATGGADKSDTAEHTGPTAKPGAETVTKPANTAAVIRDTSEGYTRISLDTQLIAPRLRAANELIRAGDLRGADAELKALQAAVILEAVAVDLPMVEARQNLGLALAAARDGRTADAAAQTAAAESALRRVAASGTWQAAQARDLADRIARDKQAPTADALAGWWNEAAALTSA